MWNFGARRCDPNSPRARDRRYICNPETGRWVLRTGAAGRRVSARQNARRRSPRRSRRRSPRRSRRRSSTRGRQGASRARRSPSVARRPLRGARSSRRPRRRSLARYQPRGSGRNIYQYVFDPEVNENVSILSEAGRNIIQQEVAEEYGPEWGDRVRVLMGEFSSLLDTHIGTLSYGLMTYNDMKEEFRELSHKLPDYIKDGIMLTFYVKVGDYVLHNMGFKNVFIDMTTYLGWKAVYNFAKAHFHEYDPMRIMRTLHLFVNHIMEIPFGDIYPIVKGVLSIGDINRFRDLEADYIGRQSTAETMNALLLSLKSLGSDERTDDVILLEESYFDYLSYMIEQGIDEFMEDELLPFRTLLYLADSFDPFISGLDREFIVKVFNIIVEKYLRMYGQSQHQARDEYKRVTKKLKTLIGGDNLDIDPEYDVKKVADPIDPVGGARYVDPASGCEGDEDVLFGVEFASMGQEDLISVKIGTSNQCFARNDIFQALLKSPYVFMNPKTSFSSARIVGDAVDYNVLPSAEDDIDITIRKLDFLFTRPSSELDARQKKAKDIIKYVRLYKFPLGQWVNADALKAVGDTAYNRYTMRKINPGQEIASLIPNAIGAVHGTFDIYTIYPESEGCKTMYEFTATADGSKVTLSKESFAMIKDEYTNYITGDNSDSGSDLSSVWDTRFVRDYDDSDGISDRDSSYDGENMR